MNKTTTLMPASMPAIAPELPTPYELNGMTTAQLRNELARSIAMSAKHLVYLAGIWAELEKRGEDLSELRTGLAAYLPQIAAGQLDASAVIRFAGQPTVLRSISSLPPARQKALATGEPVRVLTVNAAGEYESAEMPAYAMTAGQAKLVFDGSKMRDPEEQRATLESARLTAKRRARPSPKRRVRYDEKADVIRLGTVSAYVGEVIAAIAKIEKIDRLDDENKTSTIMLKLSEAEHRMLKIRIAESGESQQDYIRAVLLKYSILN